MKTILIIEDEKKIRRFLQLELEHEGYSVITVENGEEGLNKVKNNHYDIVLLDLMLPRLSGEEVCKEIRKFSEIPIIILTAKDQTLNKVELLDMGADDYLTKPFAIEELLARIRVALRNKKDFTDNRFLTYYSLKLDLETKTLYRNDEEISLTKKEFNLFYLLMLNKEIVISREKILEEVWGYDFLGDEKIVDVYINALRKKIENEDEKYIQTVRGFGYTLKSRG
ncbi:MAG: response regulator transcription factor [Fusobacterium sp.]|uniref:response regulator transcription factor n=1 Tax=Fusobacterium sp. TaxID=68766 RepID=UPI0025D00380|nr:response regulator transcription factor [uncultured Fusobacterium sp.]